MAELPPIPARCAGQPTAGGLVVPHISVVADGQPRLGAVHNSKAMQCIVDYRCQIDGQPLTRPMVVLVSDRDLVLEYSAEPALHPECAAYSTKACPMLAGRQTTYHHASKHLGAACNVPGCGCDGWTDTYPDKPSKRGEQADQWWAVWLDDYQIAVNSDRRVHGLAWRGITPRRVRRVPGTGHGTPGGDG